MDQARQEFLNHLKVWTKEMHTEGPFFLGEDISLPDLVLAPWAVRLWVFDEFKSGGLGVPREGEGGSDERIWSRWRACLAAVESIRSIKETTSDLAHYLPSIRDVRITQLKVSWLRRHGLVGGFLE